MCICQVNIKAAVHSCRVLKKWKRLVKLCCLSIGWEPPYHCKVSFEVPLNQSLPYDGDKLSKCEMYVNSSVDNRTTDCQDGIHYYNDGYETIVTEVSDTTGPEA